MAKKEIDGTHDEHDETGDYAMNLVSGERFKFFDVGDLVGAHAKKSNKAQELRYNKAKTKLSCACKPRNLSHNDGEQGKHESLRELTERVVYVITPALVRAVERHLVFEITLAKTSQHPRFPSVNEGARTGARGCLAVLVV